MAVTSSQFVIGTEINLDAVRLLKYDVDDDYSQEYGQIQEAFRALRKDDLLQPYIPHDEFRSSSVRADDVG